MNKYKPHVQSIQDDQTALQKYKKTKTLVALDRKIVNFMEDGGMAKYFEEVVTVPTEAQKIVQGNTKT